MTTTAGSEPAAPVADGPPSTTGAAALRRRQLGAALVIIGSLVVAGVLIGLIWSLLAPTVPCIVVDGGCQYEAYQGGRFFIGEGLFGLLLIVCGVVAAIVARRWLRELGWPVVIALAVGTVLAGLVAWRTGVWFGPDGPNGQSLPEGAIAQLPLQLHATGLLVVGAIGALLVTLAIALMADDEDAGGDPEPASTPPDPAELAAWIQSRDQSGT